MKKWLLGQDFLEPHKESIVRLDLIFDNCKMIQYLTERGNAINSYDNKERRKIERKINILKSKQYYTPILGAFVIMNNYDDAEKLRKADLSKNKIVLSNNSERRPSRCCGMLS